VGKIAKKIVWGNAFFVNSALKIQAIVKNTLLQTAFSAILPAVQTAFSAILPAGLAVDLDFWGLICSTRNRASATESIDCRVLTKLAYSKVEIEIE